MRVERHLLRLAKIGAPKRRAAVGETHLRRLHRQRQPRAALSPRGASRTDMLRRDGNVAARKRASARGPVPPASSSQIDARCHARAVVAATAKLPE
jgi:hypothetical protein